MSWLKRAINTVKRTVDNMGQGLANSTLNLLQGNVAGAVGDLALGATGISSMGVGAQFTTKGQNDAVDADNKAMMEQDRLDKEQQEREKFRQRSSSILSLIGGSGFGRSQSIGLLGSSQNKGNII